MTKENKVFMSALSKNDIVAICLGESIVDIPQQIIVVGYNTGYLDNDRAWAALEVADNQEYQFLYDTPYMENIRRIKLKIANYNEENLDAFIGKVYTTQNFEILINEKNTKFGKEISGLCFRSPLSELI